VSLESSTLHPLQSLTDLITISESINDQKIFGRKPKIVLTWAPHVKPLPQCVANSFAQWVNKWGEAEFTITHPIGYELKEEFTNGAKIEYDQDEALKNADFIYVKNWSAYTNYGSMPEVEGSRFVVQIGAFAEDAKVKEVRLKLEKAGLKTYTNIANTKDGPRTRVRVGPFASKDEAEKMANKIKQLQLQPQVLTL
jgi:ornithine carbamoyltransferase